jgi:hypothetical protein
MPVIQSLAEKVRFDVFEVDLRAGELLREGQKIKLQEQPFHVLSLLLQRPGEMVTRGRHGDARGYASDSDRSVRHRHPCSLVLRPLHPVPRRYPDANRSRSRSRTHPRPASGLHQSFTSPENRVTEFGDATRHAVSRYKDTNHRPYKAKAKLFRF